MIRLTVSLQLAFGTWQGATSVTQVPGRGSRGTSKAAKQLQCLQPSPRMVCSHHCSSSQSHSQHCVGIKKRCWYLPWPSEKLVAKEMKYQQGLRVSVYSGWQNQEGYLIRRVNLSPLQLVIFQMTLRSHFHCSRDALFGLWLQTTPSGLSDTAIPSQVPTQLTLTLPKLYVWQQSGCIKSSLLRHPVPESGHVLQSFLGLDWCCPLLLFENIYWKVPTRGISVFHLFSLVIPHILRILHWALLGIHQTCVLSCQD